MNMSLNAPNDIKINQVVHHHQPFVDGKIDLALQQSSEVTAVQATRLFNRNTNKNNKKSKM